MMLEWTRCRAFQDAVIVKVAGRFAARRRSNTVGDNYFPQASPRNSFAQTNQDGLSVTTDIMRKRAKVKALSGHHKYHVYCSPSNAGALELMHSMRETLELADLSISSDKSQLGECEQVLQAHSFY